MDTISGLPAHPLLVHIPVILLPLAALGVVVMLIKPAWHRRYRWAVLVVTAIGTVGAVLAAGAGESLESDLRRAGAPNVWESHAESGDSARLFAILFLIAVAAYVLVPWFLERRSGSSHESSRASDLSAAAGPTARPSVRATPTWLSIALAVLVVAGAVGSVVSIIDAGHSGAKAVWEVPGG